MFINHNDKVLHYFGQVDLFNDRLESRYIIVFCDDNGVVYWDDVYYADNGDYDDLLVPGQEGYDYNDLNVSTPDEFGQFMKRFDYVSDVRVRRDIEVLLGSVGA